jgi:hypothetical protein
VVFIASEIGSRSLSAHIGILRGDQTPNPALPELRLVVNLEDMGTDISGVEMQSYSQFSSVSQSVLIEESTLRRAEISVKPEDVLNLQFTSGKDSTRSNLTHNLIL